MAPLRRSLVALFALTGIAIPVVGCSSSTADDIGDQEGAVTPDTKGSAAVAAFEQAATCDNLFKDRAAFRDADLAEGVLRWKCGDVPDVTMSACETNLEKLREAEAKGKPVDAARDQALEACGDGLGQEYCEYNAVAKGYIVNSPAAVKTAGLKDSDVVQCLFTSTYSDVMEDASADYRAMLGRKIAASGALQGVTADTKLEPRASGMRQWVNSRTAADMLLSDCVKLANEPSHQIRGGGTMDHKAVYADSQRQVACYRKWSEATSKGDKTLAEKLATACGGPLVKMRSPEGKEVTHRKGVDLAKADNWAKATALGVAVDEASDADRDLSACVMIRYAEHGGVAWRNSDPTICARAFRVANECGVTSFASIPEGGVASDPTPQGLRWDGFEMMGWTNRKVLPTGCKYVMQPSGAACSPADAQAGKCYSRAVACTPNANDVKAYKSQGRSLQELCKEKFAQNVAMQAPVGLLAQGTLREETPFCKAFAAGSRKIKGQ
jgi:hypothetical protein